MLEQTRTKRPRLPFEETECLEVTRHSIAVLLQRKPLAGMDMLTVLGRQFCMPRNNSCVCARAAIPTSHRKEATLGERVSDSVSRFGGSWVFIITFLILSTIYIAVMFFPAPDGLGSLSFHSSQSVSLNARGIQAPGDHDEPESPGYEGRLRSELDFGP